MVQVVRLKKAERERERPLVGTFADTALSQGHRGEDAHRSSVSTVWRDAYPANRYAPANLGSISVEYVSSRFSVQSSPIVSLEGSAPLRCARSWIASRKVASATSERNPEASGPATSPGMAGTSICALTAGGATSCANRRSARSPKPSP